MTTPSRTFTDGRWAVEALAVLEGRGIVTTDPAQAARCCGMPRDQHGFCLHREYHPIYVADPARASQKEANERA